MDNFETQMSIYTFFAQYLSDNAKIALKDQNGKDLFKGRVYELYGSPHYIIKYREGKFVAVNGLNEDGDLEITVALR